jgi:hypothetical protein
LVASKNNGGSLKMAKKKVMDRNRMQMEVSAIFNTRMVRLKGTQLWHTMMKKYIVVNSKMARKRVMDTSIMEYSRTMNMMANGWMAKDMESVYSKWDHLEEWKRDFMKMIKWLKSLK